MQKRSISLALTAAVLLWCLGALSARAGSVGLPTTLDHFVNPDGTSNGNYTNVERQIDPYTFSHFTYSTDPLGSPPSLANITVTPYSPPLASESGITFSGGFNALAGTTVDYAIGFTVTAPAGTLINDAVLSAAMGNNGGTGSVSIVDLLTFPNGSVKSMEASLPGSDSASTTFSGVQSIMVQKDVFLSGGSLGANVSVINEGFSSSASVPEPSSIISLTIGIAVVLGAIPLFSKRKAVA
jgi:hypothetical protein